MRKFTRISQDAFDSMQIEVGLLLRTLDTEGNTEVKDEDIICSTSGGINIVCKPTFVDYGDDIDNVPANTIELKEIDGWDCSIAFTTNEANIETVKLALGVAAAEGNKISPTRGSLKDAAKDIWWAGDRKDGGWVACCLKKALSTEGFSLKTTKKGKGQISCTLTGHVSIAAQDEIPMDFYVQEGTAAAATAQEGEEE